MLQAVFGAILLGIAAFADAAAAASCPAGERGAITYLGGDGSSVEQAVLICGARREQDGIAAEHVWIARSRPGYRQGRQSLLGGGPRRYDVLDLVSPGGEKQSVFFDISDFFGRL